MSYPKDLDEYTDTELEEELSRRQLARERGDCDYCGRASHAKPCRFPKRHAKPGELLKQRLKHNQFSEE